MMKRQRIILLFTVIFTLCLVTGCRNIATENELIDLSVAATALEEDVEEKTASVTCYFQDKNGFIVPVDTEIPWTEGIAKAVIRRMMATSELQRDIVTMGLESLMPPEATIKGLDISNGLAKIDFATDKLTFDSAKSEQNFVDGVVLALTAFPTVKEVQFMFNGRVIEALPNGTPVSAPRKATDINSAGVAEGEAVSVYYHASGATTYSYIVPVTVYIKNATCFDALNYLVSNDFGGKLDSVPTGTKLLAVEEIDGTLCIFFSEEFNALKNSPLKETATVNSIALTVSAFSDLRIKIYAGSSEYIPYEGIDTPTFANVI